MDNHPNDENEMRLIRAQLESLAKQQKRQIEVFEKISGELKEIRAAVVIMLLIFVFALMILVYRFWPAG